MRREVGGGYLASEEMDDLWASRLEDRRVLYFLRGRSVPVLELDLDITSTKRVKFLVTFTQVLLQILGGNVPKCCFEV
jgi:hypothetical protein